MSSRDISRDLKVLADCSLTCVLVEGPSGCGKTAMLTELAADQGKQLGVELLHLHLGEQVDGKVAS